MKQLKLLALIFIIQSVSAEEAVFNLRGIAISGYDVVSYYVDAKTTKGETHYSHTWRNVAWHFSSETNRDLFIHSPERYAPQYGGFCAYAAAKGSLAPTDPHAWTIYRDKLYLNYSKGVRDTWRKDIDNYIVSAGENWPRLNNRR